ncbi:hypothetical protein AR457_39460 [Streptomyces agglomeratus]|uniref:hypothetical protein n=1 Tax=Streptomyces agglomeratus TaxID=285458 RepID=UPI00085269DD|nr:hypothetical protein [Streptomyces agglomeratus]OEJ21997.1 hypothetical protein AR457_39460 [Streptomyces agglomeratus]OEJ56762.1 hypothetical protein BGM19_00515 [Streptomyces agglomeratus]
MGKPMDVARLRSLIDGVLATLYTRYGLKELPALCERLGLPAPNEGNTKHERLVASLRACPDDRLLHVADAVLDQEQLAQAERLALQDVLWLGRHHVQIPSRTRRERPETSTCPTTSAIRTASWCCWADYGTWTTTR